QPIGRLVSFRLGLLIYGLGSLLPGSPAPGMAIATIELTRRGLHMTRAALVLFWCCWFNLRAFFVLAVLTAFTATLRGRVPADLAGFVISGALFVVAGLFLTAAVVSDPGIAYRVARILERLKWRGVRITSPEAATRLHQTAMEMVSSN